MAHIEISNLNSAGSDLFAGADSFLTELQTTETTQIFGGSKKRCAGRGGKKTSFKVVVVKKTSWKAPKTPVKVACRPAPCFVPVKRKGC
jgi:hypothetical protein